MKRDLLCFLIGFLCRLTLNREKKIHGLNRKSHSWQCCKIIYLHNTLPLIRGSYIPRKNPKFLFFLLKSKIWSYLMQGNWNFWKILLFDNFFSILKKSSFPCFSTFDEKTIVKFWYFLSRCHKWLRINKPFSYFYSPICGCELVLLTYHYP